MYKSTKILFVILTVIASFIMLSFISFIIFLFFLDRNQWEQGVRDNINVCINEVCRNTGKEYSEITELILDPGPDNGFSGWKCNLLEKLTNLETITIIGISNDTAAQLIFDKLTNLKKLRSVEIKDSDLESIGRLADIDGLISLSIPDISFPRYGIADIDSLGYKGSFKNLESLTLGSVGIKELPDLSGLTNLSSLSINEYSFEKLEHGCVNWETLTYLDIEYTDINSLDDRIVEDLYNLESLNISNTYINDIQFVLKLPNLKYFSCHHSYEFPMDKEPLKDHPNFNSSWLD